MNYTLLSGNIYDQLSHYSHKEWENKYEVWATYTYYKKIIELKGIKGDAREFEWDHNGLF